MAKTFLSTDTAQATVIYEGWLNVWEVRKDSTKTLFSDGKTPLPVWEPHLCAIDESTRKLSHFRTEKAALDTRRNMAVVRVAPLGGSKEDFDRRYGYKPVDRTALPVDPLLATLEAAAEDKGRVLDSRCGNSNTMPPSLEKSSPAEDRRGSTSSLNSQEVSKPANSSQSKLANFFSRKGQQLKSNLKRTKSATKLDRKKMGNNGDYDNRSDNKQLPAAAAAPSAATLPAGLPPPPFSRSLSLGRISRRWLTRPPFLGPKGSDEKGKDASSEKIRNQKMRESHSHDSLETCASSLHCIDLSNEGVDVQPLHHSVLGLHHCFVVVTGGNAGYKYYSCSSAEEQNRWIKHLRLSIRPSLDLSYRKKKKVPTATLR